MVILLVRLKRARYQRIYIVVNNIVKDLIGDIMPQCGSRKKKTKKKKR